MASTAPSNEPLALSIAARCRSPWEYFSIGRVQRGVGRMQVRPAGFAVGPSGHGDLTEDGAQAAGVAGLHARSTAPVGVPNLDPALPDGTQVHVVLE